MHSFRTPAFAIGILFTATSAYGAATSYSNTLSGADNYNASYSDIRSLWATDVAGMTTVTFGDAPVGYSWGSVLFYNGSGFTTPSGACPSVGAGEACFDRVASGGHSRNVQNGANDPVPAGTRFFQGASGGINNYMLISVPFTTTALALDLYTYGGGDPLNVQLLDTSGATITTWNGVPTNNNATAAFFGIKTDVAIGSVIVRSATGNDPALVRLDYGTVSAPPPPAETPESATLAYVAIGLAGVLLGRHRRNTRLVSNPAL